MFSRPRWPLGMADYDGANVILFEPYQTQDPLGDCSICLSQLKYNKYIELKGCGHSFCKSCVLNHAAQRFLNRLGTYACPLCRSSDAHLVFRMHVDASDPLPGIPSTGQTRMFALCDQYENWHVYIVENAVSKTCFINAALSTGLPVAAFTNSQTCWLSPFSGWIVPNGVPAKNPKFTIEQIGSVEYPC